VKDLLAAGLNVHFEGGKADDPPLWRVERYVTRVARFATRSERARREGASDRAPRVWGKDQAIDRRQALRLVTIEAARFITEEKMLGSIEKGKYADLVVLGGDFLGVPEDQIATLDPEITIVGGHVVFEAPR
jgi:predicted amidohydrolase YtcJ